MGCIFCEEAGSFAIVLFLREFATDRVVSGVFGSLLSLLAARIEVLSQFSLCELRVTPLFLLWRVEGVHALLLSFESHSNWSKEIMLNRVCLSLYSEHSKIEKAILTLFFWFLVMFNDFDGIYSIFIECIWHIIILDLCWASNQNSWANKTVSISGTTTPSRGPSSSTSKSSVALSAKTGNNPVFSIRWEWRVHVSRFKTRRWTSTTCVGFWEFCTITNSTILFSSVKESTTFFRIFSPLSRPKLRSTLTS